MDFFLGQLEACVYSEDYDHYSKLVNENLNLIDKLENDWWRELYYEGDRKEISFWINFQKRPLNISYISLIPIEYEDLYQIGFNRLDTNFDSYFFVIEYWEEYLEENTSENIRSIILNRIKQLKEENEVK